MRKLSLHTQILAVNALLITATSVAAIAVARLDTAVYEQRQQALILVAGILATVLVNGLVLRRRFDPLERLTATMERVDLTEPGVRATVTRADSADVARLAGAFNRMLDRLEAERAQTATAVLRTQETERARLARDLHDEANQALTGVLLRLEATAQDAPHELREELRETKRLATQAMEELLRLARELRPAALDDHGLEAALRTHVDRFSQSSGIPVSLAVADGLAELDEDQQTVVYRVVQESLSNVMRHSGATRAAVKIERDRGCPLVRIEDDGRGFARLGAGGHGLTGMRERARLAGGRVDVHSAHGQGTIVELRLSQ
jgi:two-component system sensor histidine kinase UhpB